MSSPWTEHNPNERWLMMVVLILAALSMVGTVRLLSSPVSDPAALEAE